MKNIKTIITDLDGTLLNSRSKIEPETKKLLLKAQKQGINIILASGRSTKSIIPYALELDMDKHGGLIISNNGACIYDCKTNSVLFSQKLEVSTIKDILTHLEQFDTTVIINDGSYVYVHDAYSGTISFENPTTREIGLYNTIEGEARSTDTLIREVSSLTEYVDFPVYKILVIADGEYLRNHTEAIVSPFKDTTNFSSSSPNFLEFTHKNVDKGLTIENEISKLGYDIKSMIAFGDGRNDISMLTTVEIGVAMKNADKQVFPVADIVTETNDNEGIAVVLKDFIL